MNATIETMESRRLMSVSPLQGSVVPSGVAPPAQGLPYLEQGNVYKQAVKTTAPGPQGIIGVLIALQSSPAPTTAAGSTARANGPAVTGDWNGDGRDALSAAGSPSGYKMTDAMVSSVVGGKSAQQQVFAGAAGAQPIMISGVTDGTSNTLMF